MIVSFIIDVILTLSLVALSLLAYVFYQKMRSLELRVSAMQDRFREGGVNIVKDMSTYVKVPSAWAEAPDEDGEDEEASLGYYQNTGALGRKEQWIEDA